MFERRKTNQSVDRGLGKPLAAAENPWTPASPKQDTLSGLKKKAAQVAAGQATFTRAEIQTLLAGMVLEDA